MLSNPISSLKGVGASRTKLYNKLSIATVGDLLCHLPRDYEDRTTIHTIDELPLNENACFIATPFAPPREVRARGIKNMVKVRLVDATGVVDVTFFNQPFVKNTLLMGNYYLFYGKITGGLLKKECVSPNFHVIDVNTPTSELGEILPLYPKTEGLSQSQIRGNVKQAIEEYANEITDYLPKEIRDKYSLPDYKSALLSVHQPKDFETLNDAKSRLCFDEIFILSLCLLKMKGRREKIRTDKFIINDYLDDFYSALPFSLTGAQKRCIDDVRADIKKDIPMNRLVQGDVGCGKTMIAFAALYMMAKNSLQSALMAPTEILANQHFESLSRLKDTLDLRIEILTSSTPKKQKFEIKQMLLNGDIDVLIGTHSILQEDVIFKNLGLVVTDEQHRFGVSQRKTLADKGGNPHILVMSATPIPRSLSFVIYGDLDISIVDEMPPNRQKVATHIVMDNKREGMFGFLNKEIEQGRQVFIVCPLVSESEKVDLQAATVLVEELQQKIFPHLKVDCLFGKLKQKEKDEIMGKFIRNETQILVSTTVIEVGIDVPNATIMVIENAERFGLSQLHQLRGRVGRGKYKSYCFLMGQNAKATALERLKMMASTNDGFKIAQFDLETRGPGDFFGVRQHGLPLFKIADTLSNASVVAVAKECAEDILHDDFNLEKPANIGILKKCESFFALSNEGNGFN